jgi:hypothetical protein
MHPHKNSKFFLFVLVIFALLGVGFGFYQIYSNLYNPLKVQRENKSFADSREESQLRSIQYVLSLQNKDSDNDGLSDYDEIYIYKTSPYLKDTDSDGINDKSELMEGGDPLCHKDKDCTGQGLTPPPLPIDEFEKQIPEYPNINPILPAPAGTTDAVEDSNLNNKNLFKSFSGDISAKELRSMLEQSGFTKEQVDAFSDEELLNTWNKVLGGR